MPHGPAQAVRSEEAAAIHDPVGAGGGLEHGSLGVARQQATLVLDRTVRPHDLGRVAVAAADGRDQVAAALDAVARRARRSAEPGRGTPRPSPRSGRGRPPAESSGGRYGYGSMRSCRLSLVVPGVPAINERSVGRARRCPLRPCGPICGDREWPERAIAAETVRQESPERTASAAAAARVGKSSLPRMFATCRFTVWELR